MSNLIWKVRGADKQTVGTCADPEHAVLLARYCGTGTRVLCCNRVVYKVGDSVEDQNLDEWSLCEQVSEILGKVAAMQRKAAK